MASNTRVAKNKRRIKNLKLHKRRMAKIRRKLRKMEREGYIVKF